MAGERREPHLGRAVNPYAQPSGAFGRPERSSAVRVDRDAAELDSPDPESLASGRPDRKGSRLGGSALEIDELSPLDSGSAGSRSVLASSPDPMPLDSPSRDFAGPLTADLGWPAPGPGSGSGSEQLGSSALWLPVVELPPETDGWMPSLAPDGEDLASVPDSAARTDIDSRTDSEFRTYSDSGTDSEFRTDSDSLIDPDNGISEPEASEDVVSSGCGPDRADTTGGDGNRDLPDDGYAASVEVNEGEVNGREVNGEEADVEEPAVAVAQDDPAPTSDPEPHHPVPVASPDPRPRAWEEQDEFEGWPAFDEQVRVQS
jgi:hypothetical protein